jgi:ATP adenylyltransferase
MKLGEKPPGTVLERLWATWRMRYIRSIGKPSRSCTFCDIPRNEDGPENLIVHRGETCYIVLNLFPYNNGHAMVIPYRHLSRLGELTDAERLEMMKLASLLERSLTESLEPHGFNWGLNLGRVAGAGIPGHLHLHVVPRWLGDTNFMPVIGETKVLPEGIEETYRRVRAAIRKALAASGGEAV